MSDADLLVNLSDIDGLYDKNPRENEDAVMIKRVKDIDDEIFAMAGGEGTVRGTGGMRAKIEAAKTVTEAGIAMVIANGENPEVLYEIAQGKGIGTFFAPRT